MKKNNSISLCMIVKNEENFIERCLKSVTELVDQIVVLDTGSNDNTVKIAKKYGAEVYDFNWNNDFSAARNRSIEYATCEWVLILDADEKIEKSSHHEIRKIIKHNDAPAAFEFRVVSDTGIQNKNESRVIRMFSNRYGIKFKNRIHEQITESLKSLNVNILRVNAQIMHDGYNPNLVDQKAKQERNIPLLKQMINDEPDFYYWPYNLAISYMAIEENDLALKYLNDSYNEDLNINIKAAILNLIGGVYKNEGLWENIKEPVQKSVKMVKKQFLGHILLSEYYANNENYKKAISSLDAIIDSYEYLTKNGSDLNYDLNYNLNHIKKIKGIYLHQQGDLIGSQEIFNQLINFLKKDYVSSKLNQHDKIIFEESLKFSIGCARDRNDPESVVSLVTEYIKFFENDINAYFFEHDKIIFEDSLKFSIGCARDRNDPESVVSLVTEYIKFFENDINAYFLLGEAYTILKNYSEALKIYLKADSIFANNPDLQKKIATMFTLLGNEKKAEEWLYKMAGITDLP